MKVQILNAELRLPQRRRAATPQVKILTWPDGTFVALDCNSLCALQLDAPGVEAAAEDLSRFQGLLGSRIAPAFQFKPQARTRKVVLNLTHGCNLKCAYCFARQYENLPVMPFATAKAALAMFGPGDPVDVAFFGGEPLLAWPVLVQTAEHAHITASQAGVACRLHVTTNGTLIDATHAKILRKYGFSVLLSLDGPEDLHNATRPTAQGVGSFAQVMAGLDALNAAGIKPMCRATFTGPKPELVRRLDFFNELFLADKVAGASIEPAQLSEGCARPEDASPCPEAEWHAAAAWFVEKAKSGKPFPYFYYRKLLRRILWTEHAGVECGAGRGYLTVSPSGDLYACHREEGTHIGEIGPGFNEKDRLKWWDNTITGHRDCRKCWARYICGGGCRQARIALGGSIDAAMPAHCKTRRQIIAETLWILTQLTQAQAIQAAGGARNEHQGRPRVGRDRGCRPGPAGARGSEAKVPGGVD